MARQKVVFPQRGKIRGSRLREEVTVHGVVREGGLRLYEVEFADGLKTQWMPTKVELLGPVESE